jgi:hypothetical protein
MSRYVHAMLCGVVQGLELTQMSMCLSLGQTLVDSVDGTFESALSGFPGSSCTSVLVWILRNQSLHCGLYLSISVPGVCYATVVVWISTNQRPRRCLAPALEFIP